MTSAFKKLMTHTLTIRKRERDWQGGFKDAASYAEKGFVQYGKKLVTNTKGEEVIASAMVFLPATSHINPEHEHWIIDQKAPLIRENMEVIRVDPIDDPRTGRTHHYEVAVR
jgi:hypothetical protein